VILGLNQSGKAEAILGLNQSAKAKAILGLNQSGKAEANYRMIFEAGGQLCLLG